MSLHTVQWGIAYHIYDYRFNSTLTQLWTMTKIGFHTFVTKTNHNSEYQYNTVLVAPELSLQLLSSCLLRYHDNYLREIHREATNCDHSADNRSHVVIDLRNLLKNNPLSLAAWPSSSAALHILRSRTSSTSCTEMRPRGILPVSIVSRYQLEQ